MHQLTEKNRNFVWTDECEDAFRCLKLKLTNSPILSYANNEDPFILDTDASFYGIGAVLSQIQNGQERVIAYTSKALIKTEQNYCHWKRIVQCSKLH